MARKLISNILVAILWGMPLFSQPVTSYEEAEKWGKSMFAQLEKENVAHPTQYVVLTNQSTFGKQVLKPNTIYEIRNVFDLQGTTVKLPERCVLLFNGGSLKNGCIVGKGTRYCTKTPNRVFACDTTGTFEQVAYIVKASDAGLVKNNANKSGNNYNALKQLVQRGSNLYLDGKYYVKFSSPLTLSRVFQIFGGEMVFEKNAFVFSNNGGLVADGTTITASGKTRSSFFCGSNDLLGAVVIKDLSFHHSTIDVPYLVNISFRDLNSDLVSFGVNRIEVDHCVFKETGRFRVLDAVVSEKCSFTNNYYQKFTTTPIYICCQHSTQANPEDKSAYKYIAQNLPKGCPVVVDHNIFMGIPVTLNFYYCAALIKSVDCYFTNNYLQDIINYSDGSSATAYDAYLSCVNVYYENNFVKDMMSFSKKGGSKPQCQIGKSKNNPLAFAGYPAKRMYRNNIIIVDGKRFLKMGADASSLNTDIFGNVSYIDEYVWEENSLIYKNAQLNTGVSGNSFGSFHLIDNYFETESLSGSGLITVRSQHQVNEILVLGNTFKVMANNLLFPLLNQKYNEKYKRSNQKRIVITDNTFINTAPKIFFFTGEDIVIKNNASGIGNIPGNVYLSNYSGAGTTLDVARMDTELRFNKESKNTGGLMQYFSSNSKGVYSVELDDIPEKGVNYYYNYDKDHDFVIECEIRNGRSVKIVRIPFHYKRGKLSYEWEGRSVKVQPGEKSEVKVWFKDSFVQFRTTFPASGKKQLVTQIRPSGSATNETVKLSYKAE